MIGQNKKNKKGSIQDIVIGGVILFLFATSLFFAGFLTKKIDNALLQNSDIANVQNINASMQKVENVINSYDYVFMAVFLLFCISLIVTSFFIGGNPLFIVVYTIFILFAVIFSPILSNTWEDFTTKPVFMINGVTEISHYPISNYILTHLPTFLGILGAVGMISLFAKPYVEGGYQ